MYCECWRQICTTTKLTLIHKNIWSSEDLDPLAEVWSLGPAVDQIPATIIKL